MPVGIIVWFKKVDIDNQKRARPTPLCYKLAPLLFGSNLKFTPVRNLGQAIYFGMLLHRYGLASICDQLVETHRKDTDATIHWKVLCCAALQGPHLGLIRSFPGGYDPGDTLRHGSI